MQATRGCCETEFITVSVLGVMGFAVVVASVAESIKSRRRAREFAGKLDNAVAELGIERSHTISLRHELRRRDSFIDRNILKGPEAVSVAPLQGRPTLCQEHRPEFVRDDSSALRSDDGNGDSGHDDRDYGAGKGDRRAEITPETADRAVHSCTAMSAVRVRPGQIKMIVLVPKRMADRRA